LLALLAAGIVVAGCGSQTNDKDAAVTISADQITEQLAAVGIETRVKHLKARFISGKFFTSKWIISERRDHPYNAYPYFLIGVSALGDPAIGKTHGPPDAQGISWLKQWDELGTGEPFWVAASWYDNVQLSWFAKHPVVTRQWHDIDATLKKLAD
jgi:hypothetical protein